MMIIQLHAKCVATLIWLMLISSSGTTKCLKVFTLPFILPIPVMVSHWCDGSRYFHIFIFQVGTQSAQGETGLDSPDGSSAAGASYNQGIMHKHTRTGTWMHAQPIRMARYPCQVDDVCGEEADRAPTAVRIQGCCRESEQADRTNGLL